MSQIITDLLRYRISIATQEGIVPADILSLAGVDPQLMSSEQEYYDRADELKIWEAIVALTEREDIGLVCGQQFPTQVISVIGYVMVNSPTLGVAIQKVCDYQKLLGDSMGMRLELGENTATLHIDLWDEWFDALRYTVDMMISVASSWTANNTLGSVRALSVGFHYQRPQNTKPYLDLFAPAPVLFGCESSHLVFSADAMDTPILGANTAMFIAFEEKVKQVIADFEGQNTYIDIHLLNFQKA